MSPPVSDPIAADVVEEARRLVERAAREALPLRLLGGVAVRLCCGEEMPEPFRREYGDLDWVSAKGASAAAQRFFAAAGYEPETRFNALHGRDRLLFFDTEHGRQVDVFVGTFRMSHEITFDSRLELDPATLPLADLLLTKLQIHELNEKDVGDALALVHGHEIGETDGDTINAARIAAECGSDWGLWRTFTGNLETCRGLLDGYDLHPDSRRVVGERLLRLEQRIESEPKSRRWKLRARIGERKRWYEVPEEVTGGRE